MTESCSIARGFARVAAAHALLEVERQAGADFSRAYAIGLVEAARLHLCAVTSPADAFEQIQRQADLAADSCMIPVAPR